MKKVAFCTLGCRVNQYETEAMTEKFIKDGYEVGNFDEVCDAYVINTCTVTSMGDKKSRQMVSRAIRKNKDAVVAVVGCFSQIAPQIVSKIPGVSVVLGTRNKGDVVHYVNRAMETGEKITKINEVLKDKKFEELNVSEYQDKIRAFLKIQDGCNKFCSYCLIPFARGAVCSKPFDSVLAEVNALALNGFQEIVLSGIHTASYGTDLEGNITLLNLIEEISKIHGIERIRIGSIDPVFFNEECISKIKDLKKLCHHFHLSLQSGCDATLKRMNRGYTALRYKEAVNRLREIFPDVSITTDVIVGFPGETTEEFEETYEFLKDIRLTKLHVFKFSPREGTKAATMGNVISSDIKDKRSAKLIELSNECEVQYIQGLISKEVTVLYERAISHGIYEGYTGNYIKIITPSDHDIINKVLLTKIIGKSQKEMAATGQLSREPKF